MIDNELLTPSLVPQKYVRKGEIKGRREEGKEKGKKAWYWLQKKVM